jgi:hypothetical protein
MTLTTLARMLERQLLSNEFQTHVANQLRDVAEELRLMTHSQTPPVAAWDTRRPAGVLITNEPKNKAI